jgi:hypothetical protein
MFEKEESVEENAKKSIEFFWISQFYLLLANIFESIFLSSNIESLINYIIYAIFSSIIIFYTSKRKPWARLLMIILTPIWSLFDAITIFEYVKLLGEPSYLYITPIILVGASAYKQINGFFILIKKPVKLWFINQ